ncbi:MAG: phenylacetic acid degradation operon negative regulatory protein PaaX [Marivibrio sp.]|uniref:phenylacetic acid degradation operon negative regulatory protein PaaX n=1 Tax=Marivibrio sp. TaxID=2039719 RepID=UPI0032EC6FE3
MAQAAQNAAVEALLPRLTLRAKSLIVTIYGDALMPHGGACWLGSLIRLVDPLGVSERMVRTGVYRLSQEGLLSATQLGRKSYYALTDDGRRQFQSAQRRIYSLPERDWDGRWLFVLLTDDAPAQAREALKKELAFQGFSTLAPALLAHPKAEREAAKRAICAHRLADHALILEAASDDRDAMRPLRRIVEQAWSLDALDAQYRAFLKAFKPVAAGPAPDDPEAAFLLRVLLIHDYRRILLRDPALPPELLPRGWSGEAATDMTAALYRRLVAPAEAWLAESVETLDGPLPPAQPFFHQRFEM